jgi:two-component system KDP operon response regulator KdpE
MKVVIIEDDNGTIEAVSLAFQIGWQDAVVKHSRLGEEGIDMVGHEAPDVVILDLGLPDISGFEVLKRVRLFSPVPIIVLTARSDEQAVVKALEWGASDYIAKPFRQMELLARVKSAMRKQRLPQNEYCIEGPGFTFYVSAHKLKRGEATVHLTSTESQLLYYLMVNKGMVLSSGSLAEHIWGSDYPGATEAIRVHIKNLRHKISTWYQQSELIVTRPGLGYMFAE